MSILKVRYQVVLFKFSFISCPRQSWLQQIQLLREESLWKIILKVLSSLHEQLLGHQRLKSEEELFQSEDKLCGAAERAQFPLEENEVLYIFATLKWMGIPIALDRVVVPEGLEGRFLGEFLEELFSVFRLIVVLYHYLLKFLVRWFFNKIESKIRVKLFINSIYPGLIVF